MSLWRKISSVAGTAQKEREASMERARIDIEEADRRTVSEIARSLVPESFESPDSREAGDVTGCQVVMAGAAPRTERVVGNFRVVVEPGVRVSGDLYLDGDSQIGGIFHGRVFAKKTVKFLNESVVEGHCEATEVELCGKFHGGVVCTKTISIKAGADVAGSLRAPLLKVDEGAEIDCNCSVG